MTMNLQKIGLLTLLVLSCPIGMADESVESEATVSYRSERSGGADAMRRAEQRRIVQKRSISVRLTVLAEHPEGFLVAMSSVTTQATKRTVSVSPPAANNEPTSALTSTNISAVRRKNPIGPGFVMSTKERSPRPREEKRISEPADRETAQERTKTYTERTVVTQELGNAVVDGLPDWYVEGSTTRATLYPAGQTKDGYKLYARSLGSALNLLNPDSEPEEVEPAPIEEPKPEPILPVASVAEHKTAEDGFRDSIKLPMKLLGFTQSSPSESDMQGYQIGYACGVWCYGILVVAIIFLVRSRLSRNR